MILKPNGELVASDIEFAEGIISQSRGLMFRKSIAERYALVFILPSTRSVSVHMLFVFFPIDVVFLDDNKKILATARLKPWIGLAQSPKKTKYIIEMQSGSVERCKLIPGEKLTIDLP
ncbi:DUF192 domain-containing protein [uncultured Methanomethylovorans sp.]|uniref:DUF192 domain-containing protein n=1 Tax=uncultured Methanomethylovorans sp. TaxID=183759 RepID=UPI0026066850|nr:DUF192 domain-containing protein [uncultured Methanomethylovorans sp.]